MDLQTALDAIWRSPAALRQEVTRRQLANLDASAVDLLAAWDYKNSYAEQQAGSPSLYRSMQPPGIPVVHSLVSLLLAAQYARDHLDGLLLTPPEERNSRIADLSIEWNIEESHLRRLFASFHSAIQRANTYDQEH